MSEQGDPRQRLTPTGPTDRPGRAAVESALVITAAILAAALMAGTIASCRPRRPTPERPVAPPRSTRTVRVRLLDSVDRITVAATGAHRISIDDTRITVSPSSMPATTIRRDGDDWIIANRREKGRTLRIDPVGEASSAQVAGRSYRGALILRADADSPRRFHVDNHVGLEAYLAGVLARELPPSWHPEAFGAQAVAARTYVVYEMLHGGRRRSFDVYADQRSQVYGGLTDETPKSLAAVRRTRGQVLAWGPPGAERVIKAYYSSCCGGVTNPAEGLEPQDESVAPLAGGVVCTDCNRSSRYRWAPVRVAKTELFAALARCYRPVARLGALRTVRVTSATSWNRPLWLAIVGADGSSVPLRADDLRLALLRGDVPSAKGLYSMNCHIRDAADAIIFESGRGFGHGVGLCQYGAQGKALRGMKYQEILYAYYPGARIMRLE